MITRIKIDGFKTFQDFELELGPFQVIIGANGAGKSNLFDALRFLARLTEPDAFVLNIAFRGIRSAKDELFSVRPGGSRAEKISIEVDLLVEPHIRDRQGNEASLDYTRLRYFIEIVRNEKSRVNRYRVNREFLTPIPFGDDGWCHKYNLSVENGWLPKVKHDRGTLPFIETQNTGGQSLLRLYPDSAGGENKTERSADISKAEATMLSAANSTDFPHALAVRQEMRSWHFLQLQAEELREFHISEKDSLYENINLYQRLDQIQAQGYLRDVKRDFADLVPGVVDVFPDEDSFSGELLIKVKTQDGLEFSLPNLSDGTIRLLALAILKNDPTYNGLLCFEEPENGVNPGYLKNTARLLRGLATDFERAKPDEPLRQLLVNTHSPTFISEKEIPTNSLLFAYIVNRVTPGQTTKPMRVTRIAPADDPYALSQIKNYLANSTYLMEDTLENLLGKVS